MKNQYVIREIQNTWNYQRKISNDFLDCIPADKWNSTPHEGLGTMAKQFRHMVCIYGSYLDALKTGVMDLSKKKSYYNGPLEVEPIKAALESLDREFEVILKGLELEDLEKYKIDFFGQDMGLIEFSHVMVQHECVHMGLWYCYAKFSSFETPKSWQEEWGL